MKNTIINNFLKKFVYMVVLTFVVATGLGAGVGIATGIQAGACLTVEAAKGKGFITKDSAATIRVDLFDLR